MQGVGRGDVAVPASQDWLGALGASGRIPDSLQERPELGTWARLTQGSLGPGNPSPRPLQLSRHKSQAVQQLSGW